MILQLYFARSLCRIAGQEPDAFAVCDHDDLGAVRRCEYVHRTAQKGCRYPG